MSIIALVFGAIAIPQLKQQLLPTIELPMVSVIAPYQGASPDVVEKQVVEPIEDSLEAVDGISGVTSKASEGNAVIMASFDYGTNTQQLVADVQQAVNRAGARLPSGVDPQVVAGSTDDLPAVVLAVTSDQDQQALADQLDRTVVPALKSIDGVGQVLVDGVRDLQVTVVPDEVKLARAGLTGASLAQALQAGGATVPAGFLRRERRQPHRPGRRRLHLGPADPGPDGHRRPRSGQARPPRRRGRRPAGGGALRLPHPHQR